MKVKLFVLLSLLVLCYSSCNSKKTGDSTLVKENSSIAPDTNYKMMIVAKLTIKPEKTKDFITVAKEMIEKSNMESGCSFYQLYQDPYDSSKFVFVEEYKNQAAVDEHFASDYFKTFGPKIGDLIAEPAKIKIVSVAKEVNQ